MNQYLSDKLRVISLISMIMVVFLHSYNLTVKFTSGTMNLNGEYNFFIQNYVSQGITRIAVPIFFCFSGYLFFLKSKGTFDEFGQKYKKRIKSLLIPYLLWSVWGFLFYFSLQLFPQSRNFFTNDLISNYPFIKILDRIFLHPVPYQLWFLRDLMVLIVFSPLIYWLTRFLKIIPISILFILWLDLFGFDFLIFTKESVFFFCLGTYFSIHRNDLVLRKINKRYYWVFTALWICLVGVKTTIMSHNSDQIIPLLVLHKASVLSGVIALWSGYDLLMDKKNKPGKILFDLSFFSFFIYAFHEPVLTIIKKGLFFLTGTGEAIAVMNYFLAPAITIAISILLGITIKKYTPKFYGLLTGGR